MLLVILWWNAPGAFKPNVNDPFRSYGHTFSRLREADSVTDIDILFIGSSHSYRGFDTRIFERNGLATFNLGSGAQTPMQTKILLSRYLDKMSPKKIIYEIYPGTLSLDGLESTLDIIANDKVDYLSFLLGFKQFNIRSTNMLIYSIYRTLTSDFERLEEPDIKGKDKYISGGYVEKELRFFKKVNYPSQNWQLNSEKLFVVDEIVDLANQCGIETVFVFAPITESLYNSYCNNNRIDSVFKNKKEKYFNFNILLNLDDSLHFYDAHHLNQNGVEMFNEALIDMLNSKGM